MNESQSVATVLGLSGNYAIVQIEGRHYPALAMQGDSLKILQGAVEELAGYIQSRDLAEAAFSVDQIQSTVASMLSLYEETLRRAGLGLPYVK